MNTGATRDRQLLRRIAAIDRAIREGWFPNCRSLARSLEVSRKTVWRDIEIMCDEFQAPIEYNHEENGFFYSQRYSVAEAMLQGRWFSTAVVRRAS